MNFDNPHRRFDPLSNEWVLVSPHRAKRPWLGQIEKSSEEAKIEHDENCFLCPSNKRVNGAQNPDYSGAFVFKNDFSAINDESINDINESIFRASNACGEARVICFSPNHSKTIAHMNIDEIALVIECQKTQAKELSEKYLWVQIFENKGEIMGCSNPHPHGQIWATNFVPTIAQNEIDNQISWFEKKGENLLLQTVETEIKLDERVIYKNEDWVIIVPFWAKWPFETMILPRFHVQRIDEINSSQTINLSKAMSNITKKYDALFDCSFPYSMGWHGAPYDGKNYAAVNLHAHYYPPLLRSSNIKKFMVGFEMLGEAQRDLTPEQAAQKLKSL